MPLLAKEFSTSTGQPVTWNCDATGVLCRKLENGAPADVFLSAHPDWMEWLAERQLIDFASIKPWARNRLVLIQPSDAEPLTLASLPSIDRLALANMDTAPAAVYAKQALNSLRILDLLAPTFVHASNVRGVVTLVKRGEAGGGIVYATDAVDPAIQTAFTFPEESHAPIILSKARVKHAQHSEIATEFLRFLDSSKAQALLHQAGYLPL